MDSHSIWAILSLAFGLGLLHALDADHIMAVSSLASSKPSVRRSISFCLRWAIGHGTALMLIGGVALLSGLAMPSEWNSIAEQLVGLMLIGLGVWILYSTRHRNIILSRHQHPGLPQHVHWQHANSSHCVSEKSISSTNKGLKTSRFKTEHSAVMVGIVHGVAGSAPLLALIPVIQTKSYALGFSYLLLFGGGVFCSMLVFGGLLGGFFQRLLAWSQQAFSTLRFAIGMSAIGYGGFILFAWR